MGIKSDERRRGYITNAQGEIMSELNVGDRIIRNGSTQAMHNKKMREINAIKSGDKQEWNLEHFFKGHVEEIRELMSSLSIYERGFLFSIATYVGYEDCCIKYDNGVCLDFEALVRISGMSRGKLSEVLSSLIKSDIIYKGNNSKGFQYFINPWIYCKGTRINCVLKTMFKNYRIRVLDGKQWGSVGTIDEEQDLIKRIK